MLAYVFLYITVRKFIQCILNLMEEEAEDGPQWANHSSTLYLWGLFAPSPFFLSFGHPHAVNTTVLLPNNLTQFSLAFPPSHHYFPALYLRLFTHTTFFLLPAFSGFYATCSVVVALKRLRTHWVRWHQFLWPVHIFILMCWDDRLVPVPSALSN